MARMPAATALGADPGADPGATNPWAGQPAAGGGTLLPALALASALLVALACVLQPAWAERHAAVLALVAVAPALGWALLGAAARGGAALLLLLMAVAAVSDLSLRAGGADGPDLVSAAKLALWLAGAAVLALAAWREPALLQPLRRSPALGALALFFAWALAGSALSYTPGYTAAAALGGLGIVALALLAAARLSATQALLAWVLALALVVGASLLRGWTDPAAALTAMDGGARLRLSGWFGSPNNLGRAAALLLLMGALAAAALGGRRGAIVLALAAAVALPALQASESRGALLALLAALAWWALAPRPVLAGVALALAAAVPLALLAVPWWGDDLALAFSRSGRLEEILSLTGRTEIWAAVIGLIEQSPWLGHGFASSRDLLPDAWQGAHGWTTTSAHNLWLQAALGGGLVGLAILLAGQAAWLRDALRRPRPAADTVVVFVLVLGLLEASAAGPSINTMGVALAWALALGAHRG
jgi:O-antigen ligase